MAPRPEHQQENRGLKGVWKRTLGRKDMQGDSYLGLFFFESFTHLFGATNKTLTPEEWDELHKKDYKETIKNKEASFGAMVILSGMAAGALSLASGAANMVITPDTDYDRTLTSPAAAESNGAYAFSLDYIGDYVLIKDDEDYELYKQSDDHTLQFVPQNEADDLLARLENITGGSALADLYDHSYTNISVPHLDDDGNVIRSFDERLSVTASIDINDQTAPEFWHNAYEASQTTAYGFDDSEISEFRPDDGFGDGFFSMFAPAMPLTYLFLAFSLAHSNANARVNANPANSGRRRKKKKDQDSPAP